MSDLGSETAGATLNAGKTLAKLMFEIFKFLFSKGDYDKRLKKEQYLELKQQQKESTWAGEKSVKKMMKSKEEKAFAQVTMTEKQVKQMCLLAKKRRIPVGIVRNSDSNSYVIMYFAKDSNVFSDITAQLIRDSKLQGIEEEQNKVGNYRKISFEQALKEINRKATEKPVYVCNRTYPKRYIEAISILDEYNGKPFINTEYKVYNNGIEQKCDKSIVPHGKFTHYSDGMGNNSSQAGAEKWKKMKEDMKLKGELGDDLLVFENKEDYEKYLEQFELDREQVEEDSELYDELEGEKEKIIREDIDNYNGKQAEAIFTKIAEEKKVEALSFNDTVDHFQANSYSVENSYYICKRTDPDNYMEVNAEQATFRGENYTKHTYNIYVDDKLVENPNREDRQWTDERFEGRSIDYWQNTKAEMKTAGEFENDLVVFYSKEEMMEYRKVYEVYKEKEALNKNEIDYSKATDRLKVDAKRYEDYVKYENGKIFINEDINKMYISHKEVDGIKRIYNPEYLEAKLIVKQLKNYEKMIAIENEIETINTYSKEEVGYEEKIKDFEGQLKNCKEEAYKTLEEREQLLGCKVEKETREARKARDKAPINEKETMTMEELKEKLTEQKQSNGDVTREKTEVKETKTTSRER